MNQQEINLNIDPEKVEARYSDQSLISHNPFGFTIDFAQNIPQLKMVKIIGRVAMSPGHAKAFVEALSDNIKMYEKSFGPIEITKQMKDEASRSNKIGFTG